MKEYKTLLFDIDGTLLDFKKAEDYAMHKTFSDHHLELTSEIFEIYEEINSKLWKDFELGLIDKKIIDELFIVIKEMKLTVVLLENNYIECTHISKYYELSDCKLKDELL